MLTFDDCVGFCDLSPEEIAAIAEHERVSQLVALELGTCLMKTGPGRARIRGFIEDDIVVARRLGQRRRGVTPWEWSSFIERVWRILDLTEGGQNEP